MTRLLASVVTRRTSDRIPLHYSFAETRHMTAITIGMRPQTSPARASLGGRIAAAALMLGLLGALACGTNETAQPMEAGGEAVAGSNTQIAAEASAVPDTPAPSTPLFEDVTDGAGIRFTNREMPGRMMPIGAGVVVFDFDGDGLDDIYFSNTNGPNHLYRNQGDGAFTEMGAGAGVDDPDGEGNGGCAGDYDNDGDTDLFVTNFGPSRLFENRGGGEFDDVTTAAGVDDGEKVFRSTGCAWGDYDGDGYLDLVVTRHLNEFNPDLLMMKDFYSSVGGMALFHNVRGERFDDVTSLLGDTSAPREGLDVQLGNVWGAGFQPAWLDYDEDRDVDLIVINDFGADIQPNVLWRNDGPSERGWQFTDVSVESGIDVPMYGMGLAVGDPNGDGLVDLFVTNIRDNVLFERIPSSVEYTDAAKEANVRVGKIGNQVRVAWGAMFFDYDNDGDEDLYVVSGYLGGDPDVIPPNPVEQPNALLRNRGGGTFEDVSEWSGADDSGIGRGGAYLDYDGDGCLDVVVNNFGQAARLFRNACAEGNHWLRVRLRGLSSGASGLGAKIEITAGGKTQVRKTMSGATFMGQNMLDAHFGIGSATAVDSMTVYWPSGQTQTLTNVRADQIVTIAEPQ